MVNKKNRLFKLLFFPISLLLCLSIFLVNSFASSGYSIENNGDIKSLNLFDISNVAQGSSGIISSTGVVYGYDNKTVFNFQVQYITSNYNYYTIYSTDVYSTGVVSYSFTKTNDMYWLQFGHNGSSADVKVRYDIHNLDNGSYTLSINILSINNPQSFNNIMLNTGSNALDYFPYGYYYANGVYNNLTLYNLFNGGSAMLYLANNLSSGFFEYDDLNLSINQKTITLNDLPNIKDYLYTNTQSSNDEWIIVLYMPYNVSSYGNLRFVYNPNSYNSNFYVNLSNSDIMGGIAYFPSDNMNVVSLYSNNYEYSLIGIHGYYKYYLDAFEISLNTFDSGYYNQGYTDGYNNGSKNGVDIGYQSGYQSGYNDGINTDLQTNGLRTLFNSILSFPVDMIKSIFNFEFMGVNIASVIMFIVSIGIVAFVLKKFL